MGDILQSILVLIPESKVDPLMYYIYVFPLAWIVTNINDASKLSKG